MSVDCKNDILVACAGLVIYGYGEYGEVLEHLLEDRYPHRLTYIVDDQKAGGSGSLSGVPIVSLEQFAATDTKGAVVVLGAIDPTVRSALGKKLSDFNINFISLDEIASYIPITHTFSKGELAAAQGKIAKAESIFERDEDIELFRFLFELRSAPHKIKLNPVNPYLVREWSRQYCDYINPKYISTFLDGGVFEGYTLHLMFRNVDFDSNMKVYGFEPLRHVFEQSAFRDELTKERNVQIFYQALWSKKETLCFFERGTSSKVCDSGEGTKIDATSIDGFVDEHGIQKVDFIKLDIEGAEIEAINGAINTIKKDRPQMAISIYHKKEHLYEIPILISELCDDYTFRLGRYSPDAAETILYAIPNEIEVLDC